MAYSLKDAIKDRAEYHESKISPVHAKTYNDACKVWADTLRSAPTEMRRLDLEIGLRKQRRDKQQEAALRWRIDVSIDALEWVRGRMISKDFELWSRLQWRKQAE
jgi:hypothetical protein